MDDGAVVERAVEMREGRLIGLRVFVLERGSEFGWVDVEEEEAGGRGEEFVVDEG